MSKALVKDTTTTILTGGRRTHIRFTETEPAHHKAKSAGPSSFAKEDASSSHSHGLKWSSFSSVGTPSSSNAAATPSTAAESDKDAVGNYEGERRGLELREKPCKRRRKSKKRRNENKLETKDHDHSQENDGVREVLCKIEMVNDKEMDQEDVQSPAGVLKGEHQKIIAISAATPLATTPATKDPEEEEEEKGDKQQIRGLTEISPTDKERDVEVSVAGPSGRLSSLVLLQETRLLFIQGLTLNQPGPSRHVDAEVESRLRDSLRGQRQFRDPNPSLDGRRLLRLAYDGLTSQEGNEGDQDEGDFEVDKRISDRSTSESNEVDSTIDPPIEKIDGRTPLASKPTFERRATRERPPVNQGSTSATREQDRENPCHEENSDVSRYSSNSRKSRGVTKTIARLDNGDDQEAEEDPCSTTVQNCEVGLAHAIVEHEMNMTELDSDGIAQDKDYPENHRAHQNQEQRRRDYVTNELINGQQQQEEDKTKHVQTPKNRRTRENSIREVSLENMEERLRKELLRHEASLSELVRRL